MMDETRVGLIVIGVFGILNCISCLAVISIILYHRYYKRWPVFASQNITLITNLLISDVIQSFGFITDLHWFRVGAVGRGEKSCTAQGIFIQLGDAATALFVILIAGHTLKHFLTPTNPKLPVKFFRITIMLVWVACFLMAIVPRILQHDFYGNVGVWCWIASKYVWSRLYLHYAYLFLAEFVSICIYGGLGIYLWLYGTQANSAEMRRVARTMFAYPIAYTFGTLPLASLRAQAMAGRTVSHRALVAACIVFSMLGSINCAVYVLTRRKMMMRERENHSMSGVNRRGGSGGIVRTVTGSHGTDDDFEIEMPVELHDGKYPVTASDQLTQHDTKVSEDL